MKENVFTLLQQFKNNNKIDVFNKCHKYVFFKKNCHDKLN